MLCLYHSHLSTKAAVNKNILKDPKRWNDRKSPEVLKDEMTENHPKSLKMEWQKITQNPKRWNDGKSPEILKDRTTTIKPLVWG